MRTDFFDLGSGFPGIVLTAALLVASHGDALASRQTVLHSFCARANCGDGQAPGSSMLASDAAGNLYGTAGAGGHENHGTVFELIKGPGDNQWKYSVLFKFCEGQSVQCPAGQNPDGGLVVDTAGNLYGTAQRGGPQDEGVAFELSPPTARTRRWTEKVLYTFCQQNDCADGRWPTTSLTYAGAQSGVPYDGVSPLYGVTLFGGGDDSGVLYMLSPGGGAWSEQVLHPFCAICDGGGYPYAGPLADAAGNLFGTTTSGGVHASGTLYELSGSSYQVLYNFCSQSGCTDGWVAKGLIADAAGALYGTTAFGGTTGCNGYGCGTVFRFVPDGAQFTTVYRFCSQRKCADGRDPLSNLAVDPLGHVYGTTIGGGVDGQNFGNGIVFRLNGTRLRVVYDFCSQANCADGSEPEAGLLMDASGNLFGTTTLGGENNAGTVFEVSR
jgi:uncharacterized repeat protein (TIGR03803 family)